MSFEKNKKKILSILEDHKQFIIKQKMVAIPSNYAEVQQAAISVELEQEIEKLLALFSNEKEPSEEFFSNSFRELCEKREQQNQNTCLSFTALPEGICNQLYFKIAKILFKPTQLGEILSILMPSIHECLIVEFSNVLAPKVSSSLFAQIDRVKTTLHTKPLSALDMISPELSSLTQTVTGDHVILMLEEIKSYPLPIHHCLYKSLEAYPVVREKLYQHNDDFKQLFFDIKLIYQDGSTPDEILTHFVNELIRSGTRYTGKDFASDFVIQACLQFRSCLDQWPQAFREAILALQPTTKDDSLEKILEHLEKGECVEQAANRIKLIQENKRNELLKKRPYVTEEQFKNIKRKYYRNPITITGYETTKALPNSLRKALLENIQITSASDYIDLFINIPASEYFHLLTHAKIDCYPALPKDLGAALEMLEEEQRQAFFSTLIVLRKKFGGMQEILKFCINNSLPALFDEALGILNPNKLASLIRKQDAEGRTLFHLAIYSNNLEIFQILWKRLPDQDRLNSLNEKSRDGCTSLHYAALNPHPFIFLEFWQCSSTIALSLIKNKDEENKTFLHYLAQNTHPQAFDTIWNVLPESDRLLQIKIKDMSNKTPLGYAALNSNASAFKKFWDSLSEEDRLAEIKSQDKFGNTLLHLAAQNTCPDIFFIIWNSLSEQDRLILIKQKNLSGNMPLILAIKNSAPDFFITIWDKLTERYQSIAMEQRNDEGETLWHSGIRQPSLNFRKLWDALSSQMQLDIISKRDMENNTLLHAALSGNNFEAFSVLFEFLAINKDNLNIINVKNNQGLTLLHKVIKKKNIKILLLMLEAYQEHGFLFAQDNAGRDALRIAIEYRDIKVFKTIWDHLSLEEQRLALHERRTALLDLAVKYNSEIFFILWDSLSDQDKLKAINKKNESGYDLLECATKHGSIETWNAIWSHLPEQDKKIAIHKKNKDNNYTLLLLALENKNSAILRALLTFIPEQDRKKIIKNKDVKGEPLLYHAIYIGKEQHFHIIWEYLSVEEQCSEIENDILLCVTKAKAYTVKPLHIILESQQNNSLILKKDKEGMSPLHWAARYGYEIFHLLWERLSPQERRTIIEEKNEHGETLLDITAQRAQPKVFLLLWECLSPQEKVAAITKKNKNNSTFLHFQVNHSPHMFICMWNVLSSEERLTAIMEHNNEGLTPLTAIIKNNRFETFSILWKSLSDSERLLVIQQKNNYGMSPLHYAIKSDNDEFFSLFWACLSDQEKLNALNEKTTSGTGMLDFAAEKSTHKTWEFIWNLYSEEERFININKKTKNKHTLLHFAVYNGNHRAARSILEFIPEKDRLNALLEKNVGGLTSLECALGTPGSSLFCMIWEFLPESDRLKVIDFKTEAGDSLLVAAARSYTMAWDVLWDWYSKEIIPVTSLEKNSQVKDLIQYCVRKAYYAKLCQILDSLSEQDRRAAILDKNEEGNSILYHILKEGQRATISLAISQYLSNADRLNVLREKDSLGYTVLHHLSKGNCLETARIILNFLQEQNCFELLKEKNGLGETPLHHAAKNANPQIWLMIMEYLPKEECLDAVMQLNDCGETLLQKAADNDNPAILLSMLKLYPEFKQLEVIEMVEVWWRMNCVTGKHWEILNEEKEKIRSNLRLSLSEETFAQLAPGASLQVSKISMFSQTEDPTPDENFPILPLQSALLEGFKWL